MHGITDSAPRGCGLIRVPARILILIVATTLLLLCTPSTGAAADWGTDGPVLQSTSYICATVPGVPCPRTTPEIVVHFDEPVIPIIAGNPVHYTLYREDDPLTIIPVAEVFSVNGPDCYLLLETLPDTVNYVLQVENLEDAWGNIMEPGQTVSLEPFPDPSAVPPVNARRPVLLPNAPNPFNPTTWVRFTLPDDFDGAEVSIQVYDLRGQLIRHLPPNAGPGPGPHEVAWHGVDEQGAAVPSGAYLVRLSSGDFVTMQKVMLAK